MIKLKHIVNGVVVSEIGVEVGEYTIGRDSGNNLQLDDGAVSANHARFVVKPSPYLDDIFDVSVEDLGSTNGTYVNGAKISSQRLKHSDQIRVGTHEFKIFDTTTGIGTETEFYVPDE